MTHRPVRILITGSRTWTDRTVIAHAISAYLHSVGTSIGAAWPFPIVVHGGARGADQLADAVARSWGWTPERHPADWDRHGRAAGFQRNAAMVALGADVCLFKYQLVDRFSETAHVVSRAGVTRFPVCALAA